MLFHDLTKSLSCKSEITGKFAFSGHLQLLVILLGTDSRPVMWLFSWFSSNETFSQWIPWAIYLLTRNRYIHFLIFRVSGLQMTWYDLIVSIINTVLVTLYSQLWEKELRGDQQTISTCAILKVILAFFFYSNNSQINYFHCFIQRKNCRISIKIMGWIKVIQLLKSTNVQTWRRGASQPILLRLTYWMLLWSFRACTAYYSSAAPVPDKTHTSSPSHLTHISYTLIIHTMAFAFSSC